MWKDYSSGYIKNNRSSGLAVMIAAFISALLLSLLCGLFYNAWKYEVERIEQEEGGWQSRIIGELAGGDIEAIKNFANVKDAVANKKGYEGVETTVDIYFNDMKSVFSDTPHIAEQLGIAPEKIAYNYELLALYLIRDSSDTAPRLLFPMFILITLAAASSLIVIIHNSFVVSMNARIHQFGIFSSIGATPKQIRACLLQEAAALCAVPVIMGNLLGIAGSMGLLHMSNVLLGSGIAGRHKAVFGYHPLVLALTLFITVTTIWISAWLPARRLSRLTPLEAIKNTGELQLKRRKNSRILALLFGVEGELAGNALKAQRKALRTASLSLILSFMAFTIMQCFFTLSGISTRETYFERYQDVWDIMVTIKDTDIDAFEKIEKIQGLSEVNSAIVYQKATAKRIITEDEISEEMKAFGGFSHASGQYVTQTDTGWLVNAPIVILDAESFLAYCEQIGIKPRLDGAVIRNRIRDVTNPDFRHPQYVSYINAYYNISYNKNHNLHYSAYDTIKNDAGEKAASVLRRADNGEMAAEISILSYTEKVPALREEYATLDYYELVHFVPVSLWKEIKEQIAGCEADTHICIRGRENVSLEELNNIQKEIERINILNYAIKSENRIQEKVTNDNQIQGMTAIFGAFCVLLAIIGIGNVFSNTLGFVRQRKREFARYMSIGMTSGEIRKMFCVEAFVIAGRPLLITLPFTVFVVGYMLRVSYLEIGTFLAEAPFIPIAVFMLGIWGTVALAYYLSWRNVRKINLAGVLRDDTMM